jgi:hypothetical protein
MNTFTKIIGGCFTALGVVTAILLVSAFVEGRAQRRAETDRLLEFVDIQPRTEWPEELEPVAVMFDECERNFIAAFEARHKRLSAEQRRVVHGVIVPRLMELTARSIDRAKAAGLTAEEDIARVIIDDCCKFSPRYAEAMAALLLVDPVEKGRLDALSGNAMITAANNLR